MVFNAVAVVMSIGAILLLIHIVNNIHQVRLSTILALSLLLGYGVGTLNSVFDVWFQTSRDVAEYFNYQPSQLAIAEIVVCLSVSVLLWISKFEKSSVFPHNVATMDVGRRELVFMSLLVAIIIYAFAAGGIGFQGVYSSDRGRMSVIGAITSMIHPAIVAFSVYCFHKARGKQKLYFGVMAALMMILLVPQGRRIILYSVVLSLFAYVLAGGRFRVFKIKTIMLLGAIATLTIFASNFFFAMRMATYGYATGELTLWDLVNHGAAILLDPDAHAGMQALQIENMRERTFILGYLAELLDKTWTISPLYGQIMGFAFKMSIPSILGIDKSSVIQIGYEEGIANPHFGLPVLDVPNTVLTSGISDFGVFGAFLCPLLVLGLYKVAQVTLGKFSPPPVYLMMSFILVYALLQVEEELSFHFVTIRDLVLLVLLMVVIYKISGFRIRAATTTGLRHKRWLLSKIQPVDQGAKNAKENIF
ncbi:MAG: hypothetical protein ACYCY8_04520 [Burkholderiales bacterium]